MDDLLKSNTVVWAHQGLHVVFDIFEKLLFTSYLQLFEGMKAYRGVDQKIRLFRPEKNMIRMRSSAERSSLPVSCTI